MNELHSLMDDLNKKRENIRNNILVSSEKSRGSILTVERLGREKVITLKDREHKTT